MEPSTSQLLLTSKAKRMGTIKIEVVMILDQNHGCIQPLVSVAIKFIQLQKKENIHRSSLPGERQE